MTSPKSSFLSLFGIFYMIHQKIFKTVIYVTFLTFLLDYTENKSNLFKL